MLLTEGEMSDHKGARLMLDALPKAKILIADRGYDSNWFRATLKIRGTESCTHRRKPERFRSPMTRRSFGRAAKSKTCSPSSKTGPASQPATTVAPTPSSRQSVSQQPSPSISINES